MSKQPTYSDLKTVPTADIKRVYKMNDSQLEVVVRKQLDGANSNERRAFYEQVYSNKGKK